MPRAARVCKRMQGRAPGLEEHGGWGARYLYCIQHMGSAGLSHVPGWFSKNNNAIFKYY